MNLEDITVEVVDKDLRRLGLIDSRTLNMKLIKRRWAVGEWSLKLPKEAPLVNELWAMGSGIVVTVRDTVLLSGLTSRPKIDSSSDDPDGIVTFTGVDHNILLDDALAYPLPSEPDVALQTVAYDVRSGTAEAVAKAYVNANIGPLAPLSRRGHFAQLLQIATDKSRGLSVKKSARFPKLIDLLSEIAAYSNLNFDIKVNGSNLEFDVYTTRDLTDYISFDIDSGTLENQTIERSAPEITRAIVAGQGEAEARQFIMRTTEDSLQAESDWGRQIQRFIDQRQTNDPVELQQAGDEKLAEGGFTNTAVKAVPADEYTREFGIDWGLNDLVNVVVNDESLPTRVTEVAILASADGVTVGCALGDVSGFQDASRLGGQLYDSTKRLDSLERNR